MNDTAINFVLMLRDLRVTLDSSLSFNQHVMNTCRSAFLELRLIGLIRKYLTVDAAKTIVCSLVLSRLDYCNSILSGSPKCIIQKLQRVQNTAARITLRMPRAEHTTPLLSIYTSTTTALIIGSKYPQHCRSKDKVIWTASIFLPGTHQLKQGPWQH